MGNCAVVLPMDQGSVGVGATCRVERRREALHLTGRSRVEIRFHVICDVSGIAASSVSGAGETCVICYCS